LTEILYQRVKDEPLLAYLFEKSDPKHAKYVARFIAEVFGGPKTYSSQRGGHPNMVAHHVGKRLTEEQRRRWMQLIYECADEAGMPDDPEFRSAFVGYIEWGSRLAVINSKPETQVNPESAMPSWGWGEARGPYQER
jgi:hemoglobin